MLYPLYPPVTASSQFKLFEEDTIVNHDGTVRWALKRHTEFHLAR
jgi:hypothetical protein